MQYLKPFLLSMLLLSATLGFSQQDEGEPKGFNPNRVFVGGSVGLGFGGGVGSSFALGLFPQVGYSITPWFDAGLAINLNYTTLKYNDPGFGRVTQNSLNYGGGMFVRAFPIRNVFLQVQPEYNWISYTLKSPSINNPIKQTVSAPSVLLGGGYGGRVVGQTGFFTMITFDGLKNINSPYRNNYNEAIP
ncbi:MAG TPA: hypothetical protein PKD90_07835, partial [Phnomibacter sp.]|nr:hypothetical protein [Phnomibacter sp.]